MQGRQRHRVGQMERARRDLLEQRVDRGEGEPDVQVEHDAAEDLIHLDSPAREHRLGEHAGQKQQEADQAEQVQHQHPVVGPRIAPELKRQQDEAERDA